MICRNAASIISHAYELAIYVEEQLNVQAIRASQSRPVVDSIVYQLTYRGLETVIRNHGTENALLWSSVHEK